MPKPKWKAAVVEGSDRIHAVWMHLLFCEGLRGAAIEDTWDPLSGVKAISCEECQVALTKFLLVSSELDG